MGLWGRIVDSASAALNTFRQYDKRAQSPDQPSWGNYRARLSRYVVSEAIAANTAYDKINGFAASVKYENGLYRNTRGIYNPVARQIVLIASYVYNGNIDVDTLASGAIPLQYENEALAEPIRQLFLWSRFNEIKNTYVRSLALLGDVFIKLVDSPERERVRIEIVHPRMVRDVRFDEVGNIKAIVFEYAKADEVPPSPHDSATTHTNAYTYTEIQEKVDGGVRVRTFKDGSPFAFMVDVAGVALSEWELPYNFVPVVKASYALPMTGQWWGVNAFQQCVGKIHEINDLASLLHDNVRKTVNPMWAIFGATGTKLDIPSSDRDRESIPFLSLDGSARIEAMVNSLPIAEVLDNINALLREIERDAPELALASIRERSSQLTAPGIKAAYSDSIARIESARAAADGALVLALQMGVSIGAVRGYQGFSAFNENSFDRGDMALSIKNRSVINDELTVQERINALATAANQPPAIARLMLQEMEYNEQDIASVLRSAALNTSSATAQASTPALTEDGLTAFDDLLARNGLGSLTNVRAEVAA